jgi:hypothetical protein
MNDTDNSGLISDDAEIDGSLAVRRGPKSGTEPVTRRAFKAGIGEPTHTTDKLVDQPVGGDLTVGCYVVPDFIEVRPRGGRDD